MAIIKLYVQENYSDLSAAHAIAYRFNEGHVNSHGTYQILPCSHDWKW